MEATFGRKSPDPLPLSASGAARHLHWHHQHAAEATLHGDPEGPGRGGREAPLRRGQQQQEGGRATPLGGGFFGGWFGPPPAMPLLDAPTCLPLAQVNLAENGITQLASDYAENELELFKKTMDLILSSENGFASSTAILNLADQVKPKKMKKVEAEQLLQSLVQSKWLQEKEGEYTLSIRSILELEQYIFRHYPDMAHKCHFCHSLCIQSQICEDCGTAVHLHCLARYFRTQAEPRCPHCKQFWPHRVPAQS
uniref:Non-structural maintenance of chromosomes element 1 homolog n=1 Tax=Anolis carolinensis TaxID=28377 RepID=A0A803T292_ANOCA